MHKILVRLPMDRDYAGLLEVETPGGTRIAGPYDVCGRADDRLARDHRNPERDPLLPFGDIPYGEYWVAGIVASGAGTEYASEEYGSAGVVVLEPRNGDAALADANGRFRFLIHGGKPAAGGGLRPTDGSLRLSNRDQQNLVGVLRRLQGSAGTCLVVQAEHLRTRLVIASHAAPEPALAQVVSALSLSAISRRSRMLATFWMRAMMGATGALVAVRSALGFSLGNTPSDPSGNLRAALQAKGSSAGLSGKPHFIRGRLYAQSGGDYSQPSQEETAPAPQQQTPAAPEEQTPAPQQTQPEDETQSQDETPAPQPENETPAPAEQQSGTDTNAMDQLKSTEESSQEATQNPSEEGAKEQSNQGFDTAGKPAPENVPPPQPEATPAPAEQPTDQDEEETPAPQDQEETPTQQEEEETPTPQNQEEAPAQQEEEETPAPQNQEEAPAQQEEEQTPAPQNQEEAPAPQGQEETPAPQGQEETPAPQEQEQTPAPQEQEQTPAPQGTPMVPLTPFPKGAPRMNPTPNTQGPRGQQTPPQMQAPAIQRQAPSPTTPAMRTAPAPRPAPAMRSAPAPRPAPSAPMPAAPVQALTPAEQVIVSGMTALAVQLGWTDTQQKQLSAALHARQYPGTGASAEQIADTWRTVIIRGQDPNLAKEAAAGQGLGFPGAGKQTQYQDCTIYALANATGLPYGVVAARATKLISEESWRSAADRANPEGVIENQGLNGGEVIMLGTAFGQVNVIEGNQFADSLKQGHPVLLGMTAYNGDENSAGHEVVLTRTFQHNGQTWYAMMDSNYGPYTRFFLSAKELDTLRQDNGVSYSPNPGTTPQLLR